MSEKTAEVSLEQLQKAGMIQSPQSAADKPPPNFVYKRELGHGGMGVVYEGIGKIQRRVAIKVMTPKGPDATRKAEERFRKEGEILKRLRHRNIVELIDTFIHEGNRYLVMEFLEGKNLHDFVLQDISQRSFDERVRFAVRTAVEVSRGLLCAHANQVIHRDIKPANIFIPANDGPIKVLDFGIAREVGPDAAATTSEVPFVTPDFAAPEQVLKRESSERSDIYALGGLIFFCLTGRAPFPATKDISIFERERRNFSAFDRMPRTTPPDLVNIVHRCLLFDPMHRYGSILDLLEDLDRLKPDRRLGGDEETVPFHMRPVPEMDVQGGSSSSRTRWLLDLVFMLAIAVMALFLGSLLRDNWSKVTAAASDIGDSLKKEPEPAPVAFYSNPTVEAEIVAMRRSVAELQAENRTLRELAYANSHGTSGNSTSITDRLPALNTPRATPIPAAATPAPAALPAGGALDYIVWADSSDPSRLFVQVYDPSAPESEQVPPSGPHVRMNNFPGAEEAMAYAVARAYQSADGNVKWGIPESLDRRGELPMRVRGGYNVATKKFDRNLVTVFRRQGVRHIADVEAAK